METYRIHEDASVYFVTYSVVSWLPVFVSERPCRLIADSLVFCHKNKGLRVNAYVIMPTHMHAIVFDRDHEPERLAGVLDGFRRFTGRALADYCSANQANVFADAFRDAAGEDRKRRFWQSTRHPVAIRSEEFWREKLDYVHGNPVRKGLVRYPEDWRFSSARYYGNGNDLSADVIISDIEW